MRKITIAALLLAGLAGTAYAQQGKYDAEEEAKKRDNAALDKQYRAILELTDKAAPVKVDPWQNMRSGSSTDASDGAKAKR
jgi:hypothetical protein